MSSFGSENFGSVEFWIFLYPYGAYRLGHDRIETTDRNIQRRATAPTHSIPSYLNVFTVTTEAPTRAWI